MENEVLNGNLLEIVFGSVKQLKITEMYSLISIQ